MAEVSVCIASYNDPEGLYLTVFAALSQLEKSNLNWEIVIAADGGCETKWEQTHDNVRIFRYGGGNRLGSPQKTRDAGIRNCRYRNVLCLDSHVIVSSITDWIHQHDKLKATISFPSMVGGSLEMWKMYSSEFDWDGSFWYKNVLYAPKAQDPYQIVETSHSAFIVSRDWYVQSGGYTDLLQGYGGEETQLSLKAHMLGGTVWLCPQIWHSHYQPRGRNEGAEMQENYKRNFCICGYVFGGQEYLTKAEAHYKYKLKMTPEIQAERQKICDGPFKGDLNLLRSYLTQQGIE